MADLQNDDAGRQERAAVSEEITGIQEDEINLAEYLLVLWKRRYIVLLGSLVPALVIGLTISFLPKTYKIAYTYDYSDGVSGGDFTQRSFKTLLNRFYSAENTERLKTTLPEYDPETVTIEAWPPFPSLSEPATQKFNQLEEIGRIEAQLLTLSVLDKDKKNIHKSSALLRSNFECVLPLYSVMTEATNAAAKYRTEMVTIETDRFEQELQLQMNKSALGKLQKIETSTTDKTTDYPGWQIDVGTKTEFLPLEYQIQATQLQIARLEEKIEANEQRYDYYKNLISINENLSKELKNNISTENNYDIHDFRSFLSDLAKRCKDKASQEYLYSCIKNTDNRISASSPVVENPEICPVEKGAAKKSAVVLLIFLMISVFAAFLLEGLGKSQTRVS